jgi:conjugative transfer signal peptidase TraF
MTRFGYVIVTYGATLAAIGLAFIHPTPRLLWNTTASVPLGFYALRPPSPLTVGELVVVRPPAPLAHMLAVGRYLPPGVPLIKPIAAVGGQAVCRDGLVIRIDGQVRAWARVRDRWGRPLPVWQGCRRLQAGEVFLMNAAEPYSLDGRYFGTTPTASVVARAAPIWTWRGR